MSARAQLEGEVARCDSPAERAVERYGCLVLSVLQHSENAKFRFVRHSTEESAQVCWKVPSHLRQESKLIAAVHDPPQHRRFPRQACR